MGVPIIGKEEDLEGCVMAPVLLREIVRSCSEQEALIKPVTTMIQIFAEMAQYASQRDDPAMNIFALRLGLFPMPKDSLRRSLDYEVQRLKALGQDVAKKDQKEPTDDQAGKKDPEPGAENG